MTKGVFIKRGGKMATNFGFMPVLTGKRYFISYKNEDTARVGEITRRLNQMGVPMWYDYGIEKGENWSREINRNIDECEAIVVFASKTLFPMRIRMCARSSGWRIYMRRKSMWCGLKM